MEQRPSRPPIASHARRVGREGYDSVRTSGRTHQADLILLPGGGSDHKGIYLADFAAPVWHFDFVAAAHNRYVSHMDRAKDNRQALWSNLGLVGGWNQGDVILF